LQENKCLKQELRENAIECSTLHDELDEAVGKYNSGLKRFKELEKKNEELQNEVAGLEEERDGQTEKAKQKTQRIRQLVEERGELQQKLGREVERAEGVHVSLNYEVKQSIAASTRLDKQLGDETFRKAMDQIYERFRECFLMVRRKQEFGQSREGLIVSLQELTYHVIDVRTTLTVSLWTTFLSKRVPSWKDNSPDDKLHVCISLVSRAFTQFVNNQLVFGLPNKSPIQATWGAWMNLAGRFDRTHS
jgi:myosin heavy subunit